MKHFVLIGFLITGILAKAQQTPSLPETAAPKWFSLGLRSTMSNFDSDGWGMGSGGQFRVQLGKRVNTEWFADYISINAPHKVRSEYAHIGWSVLYYLRKTCDCPNQIQPYVLAGHCFDYNRKTVQTNPTQTARRWGSAVQVGAGMHYSLSSRMDVTLMCQYMIHLTGEIEIRESGNQVNLEKATGTTMEGHLLTTLSLNFKLFHY